MKENSAYTTSSPEKNCNGYYYHGLLEHMDPKKWQGFQERNPQSDSWRFNMKRDLMLAKDRAKEKSKQCLDQQIDSLF